jgi:hypothetical protein
MRPLPRFRILYLIALAIALVSACGDNIPSSSKQLMSFAFLVANNPQLSSDVAGTISGDHVAATMPYGTDVSALVATYATTGGAVYIDTHAQHSGVTANNFSQSIDYVVSADDHTTKTYTVSVTVAASSAKALTSFIFLAANNPGLSSDVIATISGTSIGAIMPYGTDITALTPTFATTGVSVSVGSTMQLSGHTADNFMQVTDVVVTAADKSTQSYAMTVVVAASSAKQIMMFELSSALNSDAGVSSNEMATISGGNIAISVPYGTEVTALVPTFMSSGALVSVNGVEQVSGMSAVNFSSPVTYVVTASDGSTQTFTVYITIAKNPAKAITAFELTSAANLDAGITSDVVATVSGFKIGATVPFGTDVTTLVATFSTTGASVGVGGVAQVSGATSDDFSSSVTYVVTAADGTTQSYVVSITVSVSTAKDITAFELTSALNGGAGVSSDAIGVIEGKHIDVKVPYGTDPTQLVATFTTTGNSVAISSVTQQSGVTQNDFSSELDYTVTAQDGSTKDFFVDIIVALNPAKAITAFEFASAENSGFGVSSDAVGTIGSDDDIEVTVPYGTDVTQLVASFTTTGADVQVDSVDQVSGGTSNSFASTVGYVVTAADDSTQTYTVNVAVAPNPAKDITAFSFTSALNNAAGVSSDATGTISGTSISVCFAPGVTVTGLVATFTTDGADVQVAGIDEQSGVTANDFTDPVSYTVTAADGSQQTYTVTVSSGCYATAWLTTEYGGPSPTKQLVFLFVPAGTQLDSNADYKAYCEAHGFEQNQDDPDFLEQEDGGDTGDDPFRPAGMYSSTDYYCTDWCCFLSANGESRGIHDFQSFGLPMNEPLQVFDRGCGDWSGGYTVDTGATLSVSDTSTFDYNQGNENFDQSPSTTFATDGVVVCETK